MRVPAAVPRNIFAWMLLLSAAGVLLLWVRSHYTGDVFALFAGSQGRMETIASSEGRIGSVVDQVLLYCYHYEPKTGSYSLAAMNTVRLGGAVTLVALVGFVVVALRRENRPAAGH